MKKPRRRRIRFDRPLLGPLEADAMEILWKLGEASVRDVMQGLSEEVAYTTVMTTLTRMSTKGVLRRRKVNSRFLYSPRFTAEEWKNYAAREAVVRFLSTPHTSRELLVACLGEAMAQQDGVAAMKYQVGLGVPMTINRGTE